MCIQTVALVMVLAVLDLIPISDMGLCLYVTTL